MKTSVKQFFLISLMLPFLACNQVKEEQSAHVDFDHGEKVIVHTENSPKAIGPYSQGNIANGFLFTSGQLPIHPKTGEIPETVEEQTVQVLENLKAIVEEAGATLENVVKCTVFLEDMGDFAAMNKVYASYFTGNYPARAAVEASLAKGALVEIDAIVALPK